MINHRLDLDERVLKRFCEGNHVRRLSLFGSQLKGTARPDSDIDLLVEFDSGSRTTLLDMAQIEIELSRLLGGRNETKSCARRNRSMSACSDDLFDCQGGQT